MQLYPDILLVEDNVAHAELVVRCFEETQLAGRFVHVTDGEAALSYLRQQAEGELPRLVLLDLRLPRMDGMSVLEAVKSDPRLRHLPVVIMSSSAARRDLEQAYARFVNSYLVKAMDFDDFVSQVRALANYWGAYNLLPGDGE